MTKKEMKAAVDKEETKMGLDMYMYRRLQGETELPDTEVLYLRKANQVRKWIVDHTGYDADSNCSVYKSTKDQLEELLADCRAVQEDNMLAHRLLPTGGGYFFGAVEYNDIYFDTLKKRLNSSKRYSSRPIFKPMKLYILNGGNVQ